MHVFRSFIVERFRFVHSRTSWDPFLNGYVLRPRMEFDTMWATQLHHVGAFGRSRFSFCSSFLAAVGFSP